MLLKLKNNEKLRNIIGNINLIYTCILITYAVLREIVPLAKIIGNEVFSYGIFFIGLLIIVANLSFYLSAFRNKKFLLILVFLAACVLSTVLNHKLGIIENIKAIGWMMIYFFVAYPLVTLQKDKKEFTLTAIFSVILIVLSFAVAFSLPMYFYNVDYTYFNFNAAGITSNQGFSHEYMRLWGIFNEANRAAVYSLVGIIAAIYIFAKKKSVFVKIGSAFAAVLMFSFIILSQSRTAQLISVLICVWFAFYSLFTKFAVSFSLLKRILYAVIVAILSAVICLGIFVLSEKTLPIVKKTVYNTSSVSYIISVHEFYDNIYKKTDLNITNGYLESIINELLPLETNTENIQETESTTEISIPAETETISEKETSVSENITGQEEFTSAETQSTPSQNNITQKPSIDIEELKRPDVSGNGNLSNGRLRRWQEGIIVFSKSPIIGTSPREVSDFAKIHCPETYLAKYDYIIHNSYIELLAGTGILGFFPLMILLIVSACYMLISVFKKEFNFAFMILASIVITFACMAILQTEIFFIFTLGGLLFWFALGSVTEKKQKH
ncbi:MAG: O-antigen ligase family protein [Ruminococcaceae bacterium]|nr:O-antigen ligase family protein [Oscillospiraceae bacterium]